MISNVLLSPIVAYIFFFFLGGGAVVGCVCVWVGGAGEKGGVV